MTTKGAFTPGPWNVRDYELYTKQEDSIAIDAGPACCVAGVVGDDTIGQANANLIAAAPDLYQIAKDLLEELRLIRMKDTNAVYDPTVRVRAELAIAKAEGGQG